MRELEVRTGKVTRAEPDSLKQTPMQPVPVGANTIGTIPTSSLDGQPVFAGKRRTTESGKPQIENRRKAPQVAHFP
jgi:hypothetical protein